MQIRDGKTKEIIMEHGDLILQDLSSSVIDIYSNGVQFYYFNEENNKMILELTKPERRYLEQLLVYYRVKPENNIYKINSSFLSEECEKVRLRNKK